VRSRREDHIKKKDTKKTKLSLSFFLAALKLTKETLSYHLLGGGKKRHLAFFV